MKTRISDFDYPLPPELVAQYPLPQRDASRLLILSRDRGTLIHAAFSDLPRWLDPDDLLVVNNTRVFPARLRGTKASGGQVELLLHHPPEAEGDIGGGGQGPMAPAPSPKPPPPTPYRGKEERLEGSGESTRVQATYRGRLKVGQVLNFGPSLQGEITSLPQPGVAEVCFWSDNGNVCQAVLAQGETPLPPYIRRAADPSDQDRYQTMFAKEPGAIACPTAGLHFTPEIIQALTQKGIDIVSLTLHVGLGTFAPVRQADYTKHRLLPEYFDLPAVTAERLNQAKAQGKRLVAVGTTTVRVLESCAGPQGFTPKQGWCDLYIYPGYRFKIVDRLLTNFHLPKSSLLLLVSAFAGRDLIMDAYKEAIKEKYRFYSYGDCMLII